MTVELITKQDLNDFRNSLLNDLKEVFKATHPQTKKWLKSNEVRKMLNISSGTLQNLRINGTLAYTKVGSIIYYDFLDIEKVLKSNKVNALPSLLK